MITLTTGAYYFDGYVDISPNRLFIPTFEGIVLRGETSLKDTLASDCVGGAFIGGDDVLLATRNLSLEAGDADATTGTKISVILPMELKNTAQLITFSTSALMSLGDFVGIYIRPVGTSDNVVVGALASQIHG